MEIFDNITSRFGNWIKVEDGDNPNVTIEDFDYSIGINGSIYKSIVKNVLQLISVGLKARNTRSQNRMNYLE